MEEQFTLLGKVFCKWLKWHWPAKYHWHHNGQKHANCKLCGRIISMEADGKWA